MRRWLIIFLFYTLPFCAQEVVKGKVVDELNKPIAGALVSILNPENAAVIAYSMSDTEGNYKVSFEALYPKVKLKVARLDYSTFEEEISNESQEYSVYLFNESTTLEEIFVKKSAITQHNDTLVFDLNSFAGKNDRVLEDVIKRVPGLEVKDDGEIEYQGKAINKFYVEGKDLMQGRYTSITKAMPNLHVSKLEVLENHQPIKMLEGKVASESAAINIRLKNKISMSGSATIGTGGDPFLWNSSISPMFFSKGLQYLVNYDTNNTGNTVRSKMRTFGDFGAFDTYGYAETTGSALRMSTTSLPNVAEHRYLFNRSHLVSANFLSKLSDKLDLNTNVFYFNDEIKQDGEQATEIKNLTAEGEVQDVIRYRRASQSRYFTENMEAKFTFTKNGEENYLKDIVTFKMERNKQRGLLLQNNLPIDQVLTSPSFGVQNSLSTLIPVGDNRFINFKSVIDFTRDKQGYDVESHGNINFPDTSLEAYDVLTQTYLEKKFFTQNTFSYSWKFKRWTLTEEYRFLFDYRDLETQLWGEEPQTFIGEDYANDLRYSRMSNRLGTTLNYKGNNLDVNLILPIDWAVIQLKDKVGLEKNTKNTVSFLPFLYMSYKFSPMWTVRGGANIGKSFTPLSQLYNHYIFSGLDFTSYRGKIEDSKSYGAWTRFEFKNPFNGLFVNGGYNYNLSKNKIMLGQTIDANGQQVIEALDIDNSSYGHRANINVGKFFSAFNSTVKGSYAYTNNTSEVMLNTVLRDVKTSGNEYGFHVSNNYLRWFNVSYDFVYGENQRKDMGQQTNTYKSSHNLRLDVIPFQAHSFIWKLDYQENTFSKQTFSNRFMDLTYRFKWEKKKIDIDVEWRNILNTKEYEQVIVNAIQTSTSQVKLRPAQVLVSVRFNF